MDLHVSKNGVLVDGEARHRDNPERFQIPDQVARLSLFEGDFAKVCVEFDPSVQTKNDARQPDHRFQDSTGERFWLRIVAVARTGDKVIYTGIVDNDLEQTRSHGLALGDTVSFEPRHVIGISGSVTDPSLARH